MYSRSYGIIGAEDIPPYAPLRIPADYHGNMFLSTQNSPATVAPPPVAEEPAKPASPPARERHINTERMSHRYTEKTEAPEKVTTSAAHIPDDEDSSLQSAHDNDEFSRQSSLGNDDKHRPSPEPDEEPPCRKPEPPCPPKEKPPKKPFGSLGGLLAGISAEDLLLFGILLALLYHDSDDGIMPLVLLIAAIFL